jgi:hypothetical protein
VLAGWSVEDAFIQSYDIGGWLRSSAWAVLGIAAPIVGGAMVAAGKPLPAFSRILAARTDRERDPLVLALGLVVIAVTVLAMQSALALVFDPRYRDFPFAALTAAAVPLALASLLSPRAADRPPLAETVAAAMLVLCAVLIGWNETIANWQALWFGLAVLLLAFSLLRATAAPD